MPAAPLPPSLQPACACSPSPGTQASGLLTDSRHAARKTRVTLGPENWLCFLSFLSSLARPLSQGTQRCRRETDPSNPPMPFPPHGEFQVRRNWDQTGVSAE